MEKATCHFRFERKEITELGDYLTERGFELDNNYPVRIKDRRGNCQGLILPWDSTEIIVRPNSHLESALDAYIADAKIHGQARDSRPSDSPQ